LLLTWKENILVVEYGEIEETPGVFDPPQTVFGWGGKPAPGASVWVFNSLPSPALNNATALVSVGKTVGGSSAVNGMFFDRGSSYDYDAWDRLQGSNGTRWNWESLYPYFKKSVSFVPPPEDVATKLNYTFNVDSFGYQGPIYASFPPF
jgi:choline dehydrogenase